MAYGLKYQTQFTSQSDANNAELDYTLKFLFKDYTGNATSIDGGDVTVIQKCTIDDPVAEIKGQSLDISILNKAGNLPITTFQSEDDDGVQVKLLQGTNLLFIGFLVQDDFYELMVDYTHQISLSATDGLGLLKGVILSDAVVRRAFDVNFGQNGVQDNVLYIYTTDTAFYPQIGNTIEVQGISYIISSAIEGDTVILGDTYNWTLAFTTTTPAFIPNTSGTVYLTGEVNLLQRNTLLSIIAVCLAQTNTALITNVYLNLYEYLQDNTKSTLEQTLIDSQLFISGDTYQNCYTVLTSILKAFNLTLFQANGEWNIVHWFELIPKVNWSYTNNDIPAFQYDETWAAIGTTTFTNNFYIGPDPQLSRPIAGLTQGALRGYKFTKKQFDYNNPKYLLKNYDLLTLGALIRTYQSGGDQISEYVATDWIVGVGPIYSEYFIRVFVDIASNTEVDRYMVVRGNCSDSIRSIASNYIEGTEKDKLVFSFSTRTGFSQPPTYTGIFAVRLIDGTSTKYVDELPVGNGGWVNTVGFSYNFTYNTDQWTNVEISSSQIPFNGLISCFLSQNNAGAFNNSRETHYKDIRFQYIASINDTAKIIGQTHQQTQTTNKKLNDSVSITIDDSPRNSIVGTLFRTTKTGLLQDRTFAWRYPATSDGWKLGEMSTLELLTWRQKTRSKFEGGFIGNYQNSIPISLLTVGITDFYPTKNYIFGLLTIDYKRNQFSGTLWELYDLVDLEFLPDYEFKYLYSIT